MMLRLVVEYCLVWSYPIRVGLLTDVPRAQTLAEKVIRPRRSQGAREAAEPLEDLGHLNDSVLPMRSPKTFRGMSTRQQRNQSSWRCPADWLDPGLVHREPKNMKRLRPGEAFLAA